ncbi:MAG: NAD(P)/FAD-dependent oxidoreductase [Candidatus Thorarchaeota archaeon]
MIVVGGGPGGVSAAVCCARQGFNVLLMEKGERGRHKPCGGVLPLVAPDIIEQILGRDIPPEVSAYPPQLGLTYVPPSGLTNGGRMHGYEVHNIDRDAFDKWLIDLARDEGVSVMFSTRFISLEQTDDILVACEVEGHPCLFRTRFVVGADGARSSVRRVLFPQCQFNLMIVGQETWHGDGNYESDFYVLFDRHISPACSYLIPKDGKVIVGTGVLSGSRMNITASLRMLREWLEREGLLICRERLNNERWSIPIGPTIYGTENVLLVGDAAGLCNPLSGEGIRPAIESGEMAALAIAAHLRDGSSVLSTYISAADGLSSMVEELRRFVMGADNTVREEFVKSELKRRLLPRS